MNANLRTSLTELGLSAIEADVYLSLVDGGASQAGPIVKGTGYHRMQVYTALERLEKLGLVTIVRRTRVQLFQPADPNVLLERVQKLKTTATQTVQDIRKTLQTREEAVTVRTLVGYEAFLLNLEEVAESAATAPDKTLRIMGGAGGVGNDPMAITGDSYPAYLKRSKELGIKKQVLVSTQFVEPFRKNFLPHPGNELRTIDHAFATPTFTRITHELVSIEFYQPELTVIQIRNSTIARAHREQFDLLWKQGKREIG